MAMIICKGGRENGQGVLYMTGTDIASASPVTQYPIPAITVPSRMRYSRHKRSGISYGCHNESPRLLLAAISDLASLQVIPSVGFTPPARIVSDLHSQNDISTQSLWKVPVELTM